MKTRFIISIIIMGIYSYALSQPAARLGDLTAHGGSIIGGDPTVLIGGKPAARLGDMHTCPIVIPPGIPHSGGPILEGSHSVLIGGKPAARVGDPAQCNGPPDKIQTGCETVLIGLSPSTGSSGETANTDTSSALGKSLQPVPVQAPVALNKNTRNASLPGQGEITAHDKTIEAPGKIIIQTNGDNIELIAGQSKITLEPSGRILIQGVSLEISAQTDLKLDANNISITANDKVTIKGSRVVTEGAIANSAVSGGQTVIKGSLVKIN